MKRADIRDELNLRATAMAIYSLSHDRRQAFNLLATNANDADFDVDDDDSIFVTSALPRDAMMIFALPGGVYARSCPPQLRRLCRLRAREGERVSTIDWRACICGPSLLLRRAAKIKSARDFSRDFDDAICFRKWNLI